METPKIFQLQNMGEKLASLQGIGAKKLADDKLSAVCVLRVCEGAKIHIMSQLPVRKLIVASDALGAKSLARKIESWGDAQTLDASHAPTLNNSFACCAFLFSGCKESFSLANS